MFFRCEERHENFIQDVRHDPGPIVLEINDHTVCIVDCRNYGNLWIFNLFYCIDRVEHQVDDYLVDQVRIGGYHEIGR